jgi:hypothetical protein
MKNIKKTEDANASQSLDKNTEPCSSLQLNGELRESSNNDSEEKDYSEFPAICIGVSVNKRESKDYRSGKISEKTDLVLRYACLSDDSKLYEMQSDEMLVCMSRNANLPKFMKSWVGSEWIPGFKLANKFEDGGVIGRPATLHIGQIGTDWNLSNAIVSISPVDDSELDKLPDFDQAMKLDEAGDLTPLPTNNSPLDTLLEGL